MAPEDLMDLMGEKVQEAFKMEKYQMEDGSIVNCEKASRSWDEARDWDGSNHISRATGSQWYHETLYRSRKGRFYKVCESQWQGSSPHAEWVDEREATRWLLMNDHEIPENLVHLIDDVEE